MKSSFVQSIVLLAVAVSPTPLLIAQPAGTFTATGDMTTPRGGHTATLLADGTVLIVGGVIAGCCPARILPAAELYDPRTGTFKATGDTTTPRSDHTATLLPDGRVLIAGGVSTPNAGPASAELYDPATKTFTPTGDMTRARWGHAATLLLSGKVLIVGGFTDGTETDPTRISAELYDPSTGTFTPTGNMAEPGGGRATLLASGQVLITGYDWWRFSPIHEIYDPSTGTFSLTGTPSGSLEFTATPLMNGNVLLTYSPARGGLFAIAELYDPAAGIFTPTENTTTTYVGGHTATLLSDGNVLLAGGTWSEVAPPIVFSAGAEIYDPVKGTFGRTGSMHANRWGHTATLLNDGRVLIAGGWSFSGNIAPDGSSYSDGKTDTLSSAEIYTPAVLAGPPVLLSLSGDGTGPGAIQHADTDQVVSRDSPAVPGEILIVYSTGLADGTVIPPQVAIGGRMAEVLWFGKAPGFAGLNQVNVRMPRGVAPAPAVPVRLTYIGRASNEVTIAVREWTSSLSATNCAESSPANQTR